EGTTNVLSLDTLRAIGVDGDEIFREAVDRIVANVTNDSLNELVQQTLAAIDHALSWLKRARENDEVVIEAGARRFALTLGRTIELALLIRHAQWSIDHENDERAIAAARRFAQSSIDLIADHSIDDVSTLTADA